MENHIGWQIKKMLVFLPKTENQMLKSKKKRKPQHTTKNRNFSVQN